MLRSVSSRLFLRSQFVYRQTIGRKETVGVKNEDGSFRVSTKTKPMDFQRILNLKEALIPNGASKEYLSFSAWRSLHHLITSGVGVIATQALLLTAGVSNPIPTAATLNYVLKDSLGQVGTLLVAGKLGSKYDANPRLWYMGAGTVLSAAMVMELMSPTYPSGWFVPLAAVASTMKGFAMLAGGAAQTALLVSLGKRIELGNLTAKASAQATAASLLGTGLGISVSMAFATTHPSLVLAGCLALVPLDLFALWKTARAAPVAVLTPKHVCALTSEFCIRYTQPKENTNISNQNGISGPQTFIMPRRCEAEERIHFGTPVSQLFTPYHMERLFERENFALVNKGSSVHIVLAEQATTDDVLKAIFSAQAGRHGFGNEWVEVNFPVFLAQLNERGWLTERVIISEDENRVSVVSSTK